MSSTNQTPGGSGQWESDRDTAKSTLNREADAARSAAGQAKDTIRDEASNLASDAKKKAYEGAEQGKSAAASSLDDFTAAIRKASEELGNRDQSMAANLVREAASGLEHASGALKGQSVQDLTRSVAGFARRQPAAFLIGAALAGVALGRFARASGEHGGSTGSGYPDDDFGASRGRGGYDPQRSNYASTGDRRNFASGSNAGQGDVGRGYDGGASGSGTGERSASSSATLATPAIITDSGRPEWSESGSTSDRTTVPGSAIGSGESGRSSWDSSGTTRTSSSGPTSSELGTSGSSGTTGTSGLGSSSSSSTGRPDVTKPATSSTYTSSDDSLTSTKDSGNER